MYVILCSVVGLSFLKVSPPGPSQAARYTYSHVLSEMLTDTSMSEKYSEGKIVTQFASCFAAALK